jgi:hypothetical protein
MDVEQLFRTLGEAKAMELGLALVAILETFRANKLDQGLIKPHGSLGNRFSCNFCEEYDFTFAVETQFKEERPVGQKYFLKNLLRKK